ncbi:MAG: peroxiredoxin [Fimbriimonadaceae bacterium]
MKVGEKVPDVTLTLGSGESVSLARLGKPLVLFFYPKAFSPVCTAEACHFRDRAEDFAGTGAAVYGVAPDSPETLARFEAQHKLPYPSASDGDRTLAKAFGAVGPFNTMKRLTVVADASGTVVMMYSNMFNPAAHSAKALEALTQCVSPPAP